LVDPVVVRFFVVLFEVVFDDPRFVLRDATFFSNVDCVVALDFPDERVTFLPVELLADVVRDLDVEVFRCGILFNF
tara:strand:- start:1650 stop:1877 length:228 start_codon:yes stop_codon:yes gene_type:complete